MERSKTSKTKDELDKMVEEFAELTAAQTDAILRGPCRSRPAGAFCSAVMVANGLRALAVSLAFGAGRAAQRAHP